MGLVSYIRVRWLVSTCNSSFQVFNTLYWSLQSPSHTWHTPTHTHTHIILKREGGCIKKRQIISSLYINYNHILDICRTKIKTISLFKDYFKWPIGCWRAHRGHCSKALPIINIFNLHCFYLNASERLQFLVSKKKMTNPSQVESQDWSGCECEPSSKTKKLSPIDKCLQSKN